MIKEHVVILIARVNTKSKINSPLAQRVTPLPLPGGGGPSTAPLNAVGVKYTCWKSPVSQPSLRPPSHRGFFFWS